MSESSRRLRLVVFPFHDWRKAEREGIRTRDLHVIAWLRRHPDIESILVVDRPVSLAERLRHRAGWHVGGELFASSTIGGRRARLTGIDDRTAVLDQATLDLWGPVTRGRGWWFDVFQARDSTMVLDWVAQKWGPMDACIAWLPAVAPTVLKLDIPIVFDSLDNWLVHPAFEPWRDQSRRAYAELLPKARTVIVSAPASRDALLPWRGDIEIVPNGVDVELFKASRPRPADLPEGRLVGYIGKLARRIDARLVAETAAALPEVQFVFVGPVLEPRAIAPMRGIPNVLLLGDRHYRDVPAYVQHFDLCWIPHGVGSGETGGDPIKLYEYWAAGKDVVSTRIDGMDAWAGKLALVGSASEASDDIAGLLAGTTRLPQPEVPVERTWKAIADRLVGPLLTDPLPPGTA